MPRHLKVTTEIFPISGTFTIARGSRTEVHVVVCTLEENGIVGHGECVPYARYGETVEGVMAAIRAIAPAIAGGLDRAALLDAMPAGAARNAVDCALWDLEAKRTGKSVATMIGAEANRPLVTAYTISLDTPEAMAEQTARHAHRPLLKVKVGTEDDESRIAAVRKAAPGARIILDANEGWSDANIERHLAAAAAAGISLIE